MKTFTQQLTKLSTALVLSGAALGTYAGTVNKSPNDPREYHTFTLGNQLEVITVSDPNLKQSAATLSVGVGQYQDPTQFQGLAHFLEHMIFMGSEKYPTPDEFMAFVSENGGRTNAYTAQQQTTYLFTIDSKQFAPALDRLSSAIKQPLFDASMVQKEINAVNSEWLTHRQSDQFVQQRAAARTGNLAHPRVQLGVGNLETLNKDKAALLAELGNFHQDFYSANIMKLVLVGNQTPKQLKKLAKKYFSNIKNKKVERPVTLLPAYQTEHLGQHIYVQSKVKVPLLAVEFAIPNNMSQWQSQANAYVQKLIASQEEGSLLATLTEQGLIQFGNVMFMPNAWGNNGSAFIQFVLTEKGQAQQDTILASTFSYLEQIKSQGISQAHFDELKGLLNLQYEDYRAPAALPLAMQLAQPIFDVPSEHLIDHNFVAKRFNAKQIGDLVDHLTPERARIYHINPEEKVDTELTYAEGGYRVAAITEQELVKWQSSPLAVKLPAAQIIEQEEAVEVVLDGDYSSPKKIFSEAGTQVFYSQSTHHKGKEGVLNLALTSTAPSENIDNAVSASLLNVIFIKENQRLLQRAQQRNGVMISPAPNNANNTVFRLFGRSSKQFKLATQLVEEFKELEITERDFKSALKLVNDSLESMQELKISDQLSFHAMNLTRRSPYQYSVKATRKALANASLEKVQAMHQQILNNNFVDIYAHGNFAPNKLIEFAKQTRELLGKSEMQPWYIASEFSVKQGSAVVKKVSVKQDGVGLVDTYIYPEQSAKVLAQLHLLNRLSSTPLFKELRTNQQVGYVVRSYEENIHDYPALSVMIVSDNTNLQQLKERIESFQIGFYNALEQVDEKAITQLANSVADELSKKPENIFVEVGHFIQDWEQNKHSFSTKAQQIRDIKATTKADLLALYKDMFIQGKFMNALTQLKGEDFKDTGYYSWSSTGQ
ncbi:insulinase family protein [Thalassotalea euphylliae]|uniref:Protease 3 n=1 Tax=Thalassotalea euphylliae TaxID=1655234 RepID=A0A3E0UJL8_9GAMM|nr:insulinase family protein [Thalassotalea euphylliae]REL37099.1 hypothetical protein DXX92_18245 [Thalassotalea euphylliae]